MWNRLLDRLAPMMGEDLSVLDRRDGVGQTAADQDAADTPSVLAGSGQPR